MKGKAFKFGDNISTDHIAPGRLFHLRSDLKEFSKNVKNSKKYVNKINNMESSLEKIVGTKNMDSEYLFQITDNNNLYVSVQYDISLDKQYIMVYNLLLFINRNQFKNIYEYKNIIYTALYVIIVIIGTIFLYKKEVLINIFTISIILISFLVYVTMIWFSKKWQ